jgi:DNA-binding beta-propeller fold protein YncE
MAIALWLSAIIAVASPAAKNKVTNLPNPVWPPPPAEPRISYVKSISGPMDLGIRPSVWNRFSNMTTGADQGKEKLVKPFGLALDERDNLCVTDMGTGRVWLFDLAKKRAQFWNKIGKYAFVSPVAIAKRNNAIFVADSALQQVVAFNDKGKFLFALNQELQRPAGLAIRDDKIFVADSAVHHIAVFELAGKYLYKFGKHGAGAGELSFPTHLAFDNQGHLVVTDSMNSRVQVFEAEGRFLRQIGSAGDGSGHFSRPKGVAVDRLGHVYVVDALFDNFQIFDQEGRFLLAVGASGSGPGQFWMPAGIVIGRDQQIYISDGYNGRLQALKYIEKP